MGRTNNPSPKPGKGGVVPKAQRPPATFGPDDLSTAAEVVYAGAHPQQWQSTRTASPLLTRHYGVKPEPAAAASPATVDASQVQPPVWPRPVGSFAFAASTLLLPPAPRGSRRPTTPPALRDELKWIAPEPLKWVSKDEMLPDPAAEAAALAALRAQKAVEDFERARAERLSAEEQQKLDAERAAVERAEKLRLDAEQRERDRIEAERLAAEQVAADQAKAEGQPKTDKDGARNLGPPAIQTDDDLEPEGARSKAHSDGFPPSPLNIRDFDDLLHLYARDIGDSLEASGLLAFDVSEAQQAVALNSGENSPHLVSKEGAAEIIAS